MKRFMKKSALISHVFFTFCAVFIFTLCLFRHLRFPLAAALVFSLFTAAAAAVLLCFYLLKKSGKARLSARQDAEKEALFLFFSISPIQTVLSVLSPVLPSPFRIAPYTRLSPTLYRISAPNSPQSNSPQSNNSYPSAPQQNAPRANGPQQSPSPQSDAQKNAPPPSGSTQSGTAFFHFSSNGVSLRDAETLLCSLPDAAARLTQNAANPLSPVVLFCNETNDAAQKRLDLFHIETLTSAKIYRSLEKLGALPDLTPFLQAAKSKKRAIFSPSPKTSKTLLLSAVFLSLTSLFSPFPYYYRVFALLTAAAALFFRLFSLRVFPLSFRKKPPQNTPSNGSSSFSSNAP